VLASWARAWAAFNTGQVAAGLALFDQSWTTAHELANPSLAWGAVNAASLIANAYLLDPVLARTWCRRALGQPRFTALAHGHDTVVDQLALALCAQGELGAARDAATALSATATARRMLTFLEGRWEDAESAWDAAAAEDEAAGDRHDTATNLRWLAGARLALGDVDGAVAALRRALSLAESGTQVATELHARAELARVLATGDAREAQAHLTRVDVVVADGEDWRGLLGRVELARAAVAAARGDHGHADAHLAAALKVSADHQLLWQQAEVRLARATLLEDRVDVGGADRERSEAHRLYVGMGAADRWLREAAP
jgi:tetratricopeptide (TPR) repeat protein